MDSRINLKKNFLWVNLKAGGFDKRMYINEKGKVNRQKHRKKATKHTEKNSKKTKEKLKIK